jgi:four helix bundle protein
MSGGFRDLRVWQAGMDLVEHTYRLTEDFPRHELYGLTAQMRRAAVSVPSNVAEGHTRSHLREYLQHVSVAQGSLAELQTQIEIATRLGYCGTEDSQRLLEEAAALARQLYALRNSLSRSE